MQEVLQNCLGLYGFSNRFDSLCGRKSSAFNQSSKHRRWRNEAGALKPSERREWTVAHRKSCRWYSRVAARLPVVVFGEPRTDRFAAGPSKVIW